MLNATLVWWALAGVVGVGLTTALILFYLNRLLPTSPGFAPVIAWLLIAGGGALDLAAGLRWSSPAHGVGGALIATGLVVLVRFLILTGGKKDFQTVVAVLFVLVALVVAASFLPVPLWRAVYGSGCWASLSGWQRFSGDVRRDPPSPSDRL